MTETDNEIEYAGETISPLRIVALRLVGARRTYFVDFRELDGDRAPKALAVIAGEISTGKSSILEFIDYCLGAKQHPEHDEIARNVRSAQLCVEVREQLHRQEADGPEHATQNPPTYVRREYLIERPVGTPSDRAWLYRSLDASPTEDAPVSLVLDPADPDSLSQFLLRACGLAGLRVKSAPTQAESSTSILSFRDVQPLWFLANRRMDNGDLVLERNPARTLKLRQVIDYFFGVSDDVASQLAEQIESLRREHTQGVAAVAALRKFLSDAGISDLATVDAQADQQRIALAESRAALAAVTDRLAASTSFAKETRAEYDAASAALKRVASELRDRQTLIRRLDPLRSQYGDDLRKLELLEESQNLFDALAVSTCPGCQSRLTSAVRIEGGECSLCNAEVTPGLPGGEVDGDGSIVAREHRSVKRRLSQLKAFIAEVQVEVSRLEATQLDAESTMRAKQRALDDATAAVIAPFISERDVLSTQTAQAVADLQSLAKTRRLLTQLHQKENQVFQTKGALDDALRLQKEREQHRQSRDAVLSRLGARMENILRAFGYPKLDTALLRRDLIPVVRGHRYDRVGSSGAMTLIALAWELAVFEEALERGEGHPGFLLIDSPQKNLRPASGTTSAPRSGEDEAEIQASAQSIVDKIYAHLYHWLAEHPGAQIIMVDNEPPVLVRSNADIVVEYSADPTRPPYGLIDDEDGLDESEPSGSVQ